MKLERMLENDFLKQIYYGEIYLSKENPDTSEYKEIMKKIRFLSEKIRREKRVEECFNEYCEMLAVKESIETEMHFELGFKTAIRLILYGLQDNREIK